MSINHFHCLRITRTSCISKVAHASVPQAPVSASPQHCKPPPCVRLLFIFFELLNIGPTKLTQREGQDFLLQSPGASASPCQYCPSHWGQEPLWSKISSAEEQHAASQHFASTRAPYGHDCLGSVKLLCIFGVLQYKSTEHKHPLQHDIFYLMIIGMHTDFLSPCKAFCTMTLWCYLSAQ